MTRTIPSDGELQRSILEIVRDVIRSSAVSADRSLFDQGLTSVLSQDVRARIERQWNVQLTSSTLFDFPTVVALREHLADRFAAPGGASRRHPDTSESGAAGPAGRIDDAMVKDILMRKFGV